MNKSYTTIEQSKKLAEILPIDSADMYYFGIDDYPNSPYQYHELMFGVIDKEDMEDFGHIPCWSLAALYHILPNTEHISTTLSRGGWKIEPIEYLDNWWCEYEDDSHTKDFTVTADNAIDACVEMIIRLNELKML